MLLSPENFDIQPGGVLAGAGPWEFAGRFKEVMTNSSLHIKNFMVAEASREADPAQNAETVEMVKRDLVKSKLFRFDREVKVMGTFFPAFLLYSGWWERHEDAAQKIRMRSGLQKWLFEGFKLWGPSWDLNEAGRGKLVGQVAGDDEADSLPVIIPEALAGNVHEMLAQEARPFRAVIKGTLTRARKSDIAGAPETEDGGTQFCIKLSAENRHHGVTPMPREPVPMYSGYLWQCCALKEKFDKDRNPYIEDVFFIWEHTDFTKPDALAYNLDSLDHKVGYISKRAGELVLLQKSSSVIPGETMYGKDEFRKLLWGAEN